ncbi:MAG: patatin-like phospholipase family protein [Muribaculaceae bacterium]|nr:patatin-like phospholipase family protein [Muribaculaceae bacterium]
MFSSRKQQQPRKPYRIGLALSGGGARGFAHLGALKALRDHGIVPDVVAGVSAGSVVAAFHGAGLTEDKVLSIFHGARFKDFAEMIVPRRGFFALDRFIAMIEHEGGVSRIEDLSVPTIICATDFDQGKRVEFTSGRLGERVAASCAIPIVFEPVVIGGVRYVDGGVLHNLPAWALRERCDYLIGVSCSPMPDLEARAGGIVDVARRSFMLMTKSNIYPDLELCDLPVELTEVAGHAVFDLKQIEVLVEQGYLCMLRALRAARLPQL